MTTSKTALFGLVLAGARDATRLCAYLKQTIVLGSPTSSLTCGRDTCESKRHDPQRPEVCRG
jgi:hypothetical protein